MRKGISPLVATVLLIAFTISVGAIVGAWVTGWSKSQSDDLQKNSVRTIDCSGESVTFDKTDIGITKITIRNNGDTDITGLRIRVQNGTGESANVTSYAVSEVNSTNPILRGETRIISNSSMNMTSGNRITVQSLKCLNAEHAVVK